MNSINSYIPKDLPAPVIDWNYLLKRRAKLLDIVDGLPPYLLLPEMRALLHHTQNPHLRFFINTIWHTGARISEALMLKPEHFYLDDPDINIVKLITLKKRPGRPPTSPHKVGRPKETNKQRVVPLYSHAYKSDLLSYMSILP